MIVKYYFCGRKSHLPYLAAEGQTALALTAPRASVKSEIEQA